MTRSNQLALALLLILVAVSSNIGKTAHAAEPLRAVIDQEIGKQATSPAPRCDDAEFLRRVWLDLAGQIPTSAEARKFLADRDPTKREKLIDRLLAGEAYPRRMQEQLSAMLLERRTDTKVPDAAWEAWLRQAFAENRPWDQLVAELIFSEPAADKKPTPPQKFFLVSGRNDLHQKTQDVARLFLGRDVMCSQCHDHPTVGDYSQADYFGLLSYLQETPDKAKSEFESVFIPGKKVTGPRLPGRDEVKIPSFEKSQAEEAKKYRPRLLLAANLPQPENELFTRNSVNRFWFLMMGRGLVHPLDLHHSDNPPTHPELLSALARDFAVSGFDVKHLLREIALSEAYQRSSRLPEETDVSAVKPESYRAAIGKPLSPEQMAWAVMRATGNLELLQSAPAPENSPFTYYNYINGRIEKAPDNFADAMTLFVGVFGNPPGEPEVDFNPAVGHSLFLMNEPMILDWLRPRSGNLVDRLSKLTDLAAIADEAYLSVLSRLPTNEERQEAADYLSQFPDRRSEALGELAWALLASVEFRMNH